MRRAAVCLLIVVSGAVPGVSRAQEDALDRIRREALDRSQVYAPAPQTQFTREDRPQPSLSTMDLYERVREQDLKQNAIVMAWFARQAANTAERIPRP